MVHLCSDGTACLRIHCITVPCGSIIEDVSHLDAHRAADVALTLLLLFLLLRGALLLLRKVNAHQGVLVCSALLSAVLVVLLVVVLVLPRLHRGAGAGLGARGEEFEVFEAERRSQAPLPRVVLCLFGVLPRSIQRTWPTMEAHVLRPLQDPSPFAPEIQRAMVIRMQEPSEVGTLDSCRRRPHFRGAGTTTHPEESLSYCPGSSGSGSLHDHLLPGG